jgi:hypothetical protein
MAQTVVCPYCTGRVGHMRGQSLDEALERHLRVGCPSPMVKPKQMKQTNGVSPVAAPKRVRLIPRADPPKSRKR